MSALVAIALVAVSGCSNSRGGGDGGANGEGVGGSGGGHDATTGSTTASGPQHNGSCIDPTGSTGSGNGGSCEDPSAPVPPETCCDATKDVFDECPLPPSQTMDFGGETTVVYYSSPTCVHGACHFCSTVTVTEDPNETGAP